MTNSYTHVPITDGIAVLHGGQPALMEVKLSFERYHGRRTHAALRSVLQGARCETDDQWHELDCWTTGGFPRNIPTRHAFQLLAAATAAACGGKVIYACLEAGSRRLRILLLHVTDQAQHLYHQCVSGLLGVARDLSATTLPQQQAVLAGSQLVATRYQRLQWAAISHSQRLVTPAITALTSMVRQYKTQAQSSACHVRWNLNKLDHYPTAALVLVAAACGSRLHRGPYRARIGSKLRKACGLTGARAASQPGYEELKFFNPKYAAHIKEHVEDSLNIVMEADEVSDGGEVWGTKFQRAAGVRQTSWRPPKPLEPALAEHACSVSASARRTFLLLTYLLTHWHALPFPPPLALVRNSLTWT